LSEKEGDESLILPEVCHFLYWIASNRLSRVILPLEISLQPEIPRSLHPLRAPYLMPGIKGTVVEVAGGGILCYSGVLRLMGSELEIFWNDRGLGPTRRFELISARQCSLTTSIK
jgi:hypothetical protein